MARGHCQWSHRLDSECGLYGKLVRIKCGAALGSMDMEHVEPTQ